MVPVLKRKPQPQFQCTSQATFMDSTPKAIVLVPSSNQVMILNPAAQTTLGTFASKVVVPSSEVQDATTDTNLQAVVPVMVTFLFTL